MADLVREWKRAVHDPEVASLKATIAAHEARVEALEAALRPLVDAARQRQRHWSEMTGAVSDGEEARWLGKAEWWRLRADAGEAALKNNQSQ